MIKKIWGIMLAVICLFVNCIGVCAIDANMSSETNNIVIEGNVDVENNGRNITIALVGNTNETAQDIGYAAQIQADSDGKYFYKFKFNKNIDNYKLRVRAGNTDVTDSVLRAVSMQDTNIISCDGVLSDGVYHLEYNVPNKYGDSYSYDLVVAGYNPNDVLTACKIYNNIDVAFNGNNGNNRIVKDVEMPDNVKYVRSFMWSSVEKMIPLATLSDDMGISFGEQLDRQEKKGYQPLYGNNNFERYKTAVNELPSEVKVIEPMNNIKEASCLYVSREGSDDNCGDITSPFRTIAKALEKSNEYSGDVCIYIREGIYDIDKPIEINKKNKKKNNQILYISAYKDENVIIGGVDAIKTKALKKVSDNAIISRVTKETADNLYYADYSGIGIKDSIGFSVGSDIKPPIAYCGNKKMQIAQYPNTGYDYIKSVKDSGEGQGSSGKAIFTPCDDTVFSWTDNSDIGVYGMFAVPWMKSMGKIDIDTENKTIASDTLSQGWPVNTYLRYEEAGLSHFVYFNALEAIDMPGEWSFDNNKQKIYIYMPDKPEDDEIIINTKSITGVFDISESENLIFNNLNITGAKSGVNAKNSKNIIVQNCKINNIDTGVRFNNCSKCGMINSVISDASWGLTLIGSDEADMIPDRNFCQNNVFSDCIQAVLLDKYATGCIISHNLFENLQGRAVFNSGCTENIIEYNEMVTCGLMGEEGGCIYNCGDFLAVNNHVRYNYIHDMAAPGLKMTTGVVTSDDLMDQTYVYGNIMKDAGEISIHSGDDHIVDQNIIIKNGGYAAKNSPHYGMSPWNNLLESTLLKDIKKKQIYTKGYLNDKWNFRHPEFKNKMDFTLKVAELWEHDGENKWENKDMMFLRADTGCYYTNNISVGCKIPMPSQYQNGGTYGTDLLGAFGLCYTAFSNENMGYSNNVSYSDKFGIPPISNINDAPVYEGREYNVVSGNTTLDSIDLQELPVYQKAGLTKKHDETENSNISLDWYKKKGSSLNLKWTKSGQSINYYRVIVSADSELKSIIKDENTHDEFINFDNISGECYIKIYGMGMTRDNEGVICSTDIINIK